MDDVLALLNERKEAFLDDVESNVRIYMKSTGKQCIALVEKASSSGAILKTWEVHLNGDLGDFCKVLYKFVRREQYHGHDLDSALTEPISNMVETAYQEFYENIALHQFSKQVRKQVVYILMHQIKESVNQGSYDCGTPPTEAVGGEHRSFGCEAARLCVPQGDTRHFGQEIQVTAVSTAVVQFLAAHVGVAAGGSTIMCIVLPLLIAYIGYQIATFPETLSEKVSKKIRKELESKFESTNKTILEEIFDAVFGGNELGQAIADNEEFRNMLRELSEKIQGSDNGLSGATPQEMLNANDITISSPQSQQTASTSGISSEIGPAPAYAPIASLSSIPTQPINPSHSPFLPSAAVNPIPSPQQFSSLSISSQPNPSLEGTSTSAPDLEPYRLVRAKFTFPSQSPDELCLHTNDIVQVVDDDPGDDGWLKARWLHDEEKLGYVLKSFIEEF